MTIECERAPEHDKPGFPAYREIATGRVFYFDGAGRSKVNIPTVWGMEESGMTDLLPCPFCGLMPSVRENVPVILCHGEDCLGPRTTAAEIDDAVAQWNTRVVSHMPVYGSREVEEK